MKKKNLLIVLFALGIFSSCKKGEKVEPTYFAEAEFKGLKNEKAVMHIVGTVTGSKNASDAKNQTLDCLIPDNLKDSIKIIDSRWQISFNYDKNLIVKDRYSNARVLKRN